MVIDGFDEILNTVYMAKMLYDMGKYETVAESFFDVPAYDVYYENMLHTMTAVIMKGMVWKSMCCPIR